METLVIAAVHESAHHGTFRTCRDRVRSWARAMHENGPAQNRAAPARGKHKRTTTGVGQVVMASHRMVISVGFRAGPSLDRGKLRNEPRIIQQPRPARTENSQPPPPHPAPIHFPLD